MKTFDHESVVYGEFTFSAKVNGPDVAEWQFLVLVEPLFVFLGRYPVGAQRYPN